MLQEESGLQARWQENLTNFMNKRMLRPVVKPAQGTAMGAGSVEATMIKKMIAAVPAATETAATSEAALTIITIMTVNEMATSAGSPVLCTVLVSKNATTHT